MRTRRSLLSLCTLAALSAGLLASAAGGQVVISQVYGGGGNTGGLFRNDFIELFNRGAEAVDLSSYSVQYASTAGTTWAVTPLTGSIQPGGYYLVQQAAGAGTGQPALPTPDATGTIAMSANNGKVALVASTTALTGSCPTGVVDFVGFGTANCFEGAAAVAALANSTAAIRNNGGCTDSNSNSTDFSVLAPNPRNSASPLAPCGPSTPPSGVGAANPSLACRNQDVVLTVAVTPGTNPAAAITSVTGDATTIGGPSALTFLDDGVAPDAVAGDGAYTAQVTVGASIIFANWSVPVAIVDAQGRSGASSVGVTVRNCDPTGFGSAAPAGICDGGSSLLTVSVTPGINPPSTGLTVIADLSGIGGDSGQALFDDGSNGDVLAGDNIFSYRAAVPAGTPSSSYNVGATIFDTQARAALTQFTLVVVPCVEAASTVVISQVYGGGGNNGATLTNDFVELYNRSASAVDLSGLSLQYSSATGATGFSNRVNLSGIIEARKYFLVQLAQGAGGTTPLPTPDLDFGTGPTLSLSATNGAVALVQDAVNLGVNCATATTILDLVAYGSGTTCSEGLARAGGLSNTTAAIRVGDGCQDFNQNIADFIVTAPNPRNSASQANPCGACPVDYNGDGSVDPDDLSDVISCFFDSACAFDYDNSGFEDPDDLSSYISDFFTPGSCP